MSVQCDWRNQSAAAERIPLNKCPNNDQKMVIDLSESDATVQVFVRWLAKWHLLNSNIQPSNGCHGGSKTKQDKTHLHPNKKSHGHKTVSCWVNEMKQNGRSVLITGRVWAQGTSRRARNSSHSDNIIIDQPQSGPVIHCDRQNMPPTWKSSGVLSENKLPNSQTLC